MNKPHRFILGSVVTLIMMTMLSCANPVIPAADSAEVASPPNAPATSTITGIWTSTDEAVQNILVFSEKTIYWVRLQETPPGEGVPSAIREQFSGITSLDETTGQLTHRIEWIRVNGQFGGFDSPSWFASFEIDGDTLRIAFSDAGFPSLDEAETYHRQ